MPKIKLLDDPTISALVSKRQSAAKADVIKASARMLRDLSASFQDKARAQGSRDGAAFVKAFSRDAITALKGMGDASVSD